jgi:hypothetical protein
MKQNSDDGIEKTLESSEGQIVTHVLNFSAEFKFEQVSSWRVAIHHTHIATESSDGYQITTTILFWHSGDSSRNAIVSISKIIPGIFVR